MSRGLRVGHTGNVLSVSAGFLVGHVGMIVVSLCCVVGHTSAVLVFFFVGHDGVIWSAFCELSVGHDIMKVSVRGLIVGHLGGDACAEGGEVGHRGVMAIGSSVGLKEITESSVGQTCPDGVLVVM